MNLNDAKFKDTYHSDIRPIIKKNLSYEAEYAQLWHLFFDIRKLVNYLSSIKSLEIYFFPHLETNYEKAKHRFNLSVQKSDTD